MIFYGPSSDDQAWLHYNTASSGLGVAFNAISDTYVPALEKVAASSPLSASDHASFWNAGYAAMLTIEKAVWTNPHYHQTTDLMANYLQYFPFGTNMAKAAIATVAHLAVPADNGMEEESFLSTSGTATMRLSSNPVNSLASVIVIVPATGLVNLSLFDISGREVHSISETLPGGSNNLEIDVSDFSSGMYLIKLEFNGVSTASRMIVTK
ncbi:MAG: T9SS type A sorting domain-containing protein [Candidatus Sabulitectum sp.]|nr:T9SS type A sorting domain-containing protein [Candidatus Sabulitectum sp.]